ncbi:MAG: class IV adenylate cyclase [Halodesulfurarchaeum sp.]
MYEVEMKVRAPHGPVTEALSAADATRIGRVEQTDVYFDAPHRDLAASDEALRLREEGNGESRTVLTYKGPKVDRDSKTREEFETGIESREAMEAALLALGFEATATVEKTRTRYDLDGVTVSLDAVSGVGEFVEAEAAAAEGSIEETRDRVASALETLDLDPDAQIRTSYLELLLDDGE